MSNARASLYQQSLLVDGSGAAMVSLPISGFQLWVKPQYLSCRSISCCGDDGNDSDDDDGGITFWNVNKIPAH